MKKEKIAQILYFTASIAFFIAAIIGFSNGNDMAVVWLCLGSAMLCLGSSSSGRKRKSKEKDTDENEKKCDEEEIQK